MKILLILGVSAAVIFGLTASAVWLFSIPVAFSAPSTFGGWYLLIWALSPAKGRA